MQKIVRISPPQGEQTSDEDAIIAVVEAETQAFIDDDFETWSRCWVHEDRATAVSVTSTTGIDVQKGWTAIANEMQEVMNNGAGCDMVEFRDSNFRVQVADDTAWMVYDQWARNRSGGTWECFETRLLERTPDGWKIVYSSFVDQGRGFGGPGMVAVDGAGAIVWATPEALERLRHHPVLTVSAGRIRAQRPAWDHVLQAAIARAGKYHGFYELRQFEDETGGPFHYPAVLGDTDEGGIAVVTLVVRNSTTYLMFDGARSLDRRLSIAQAVFGLSDGQLRVARHIADGQGPKGAAKALGISVNTARTHLTRLYEKTGVNSQAALVRILLSVG